MMNKRSRIRELEETVRVWGERTFALAERADRYEAALQLVQEAYRPYREDMVREALVAVDAALSPTPEAEDG